MPTYYTPIEIRDGVVYFKCGCKIIGDEEKINPLCARTFRHPIYSGALKDTASRTIKGCSMKKGGTT